MIIRPYRLILASALALTVFGPPALADDAPLVRPRLENYRDYTQFLNDMAAYKKRLRDQASQPAATAATTTTKPAETTKPAISTTQVASISPIPQTAVAPPAPVSTIDPSSEEAPPPLNITGPEDLAYAVEKAKKFPHYTYKVTRRYNRSTAQSFPLPQLTPEDLEGNAVGGMWRGIKPMPADRDGVTDDTLQGQADTNQKDKDLVRKIAGAKKADDDEDKDRQTDYLVKSQGFQEHFLISPLEVIYLPGGSTTDAGIIGITIYPGKIQTSYHD